MFSSKLRTSRSLSRRNLINLDKFRKQIKLHEGIRYSVYEDTTGHKTVGVGFNLERSDAPRLLKGVGADFYDVYNGESDLSPEQVDALLDITIEEAIDIAKRLIPNYEELDDVRQRVVADMAFNLGEYRFSQFKNTRGLIARGAFAEASRAMEHSRWYHQTKSRAKRLCHMMLTGQDA